MKSQKANWKSDTTPGWMVPGQRTMLGNNKEVKDTDADADMDTDTDGSDV
jgi:hypothetical protein